MTPPQMIRVLLVDDHAVVRGGLSYFLSTTDDIEVVGEAANGEQALRLCAELHPDVVMMDMIMPQMDGFTAMQHLRLRHPDIHVIALTSFLDGAFVQRAIQAGASGYLLKDVQAHELADAIRAAKGGRSTLAPEATQALIQAMAQPAQVGEPLSEREREVLIRMARGLSNGEIAEELTISPHTVRHHVRNILAKLEVTNRTEAVHVAMQRGLVE
jgi:two-component system, NarL family, response regulator LiaR